MPTALLAFVLAVSEKSSPSTTAPPSSTTTTIPLDPGVTLVPNQSSLPGTSILRQLASGIGSWALIAAMLGVVVGAVIWAFGHYSQNYQQSYNGRRGVMVSALAAVLIGAAPYVINTLFNQGRAAS